MTAIVILAYLIPLLLTARKLLFRWEADPRGDTDWDDSFDVTMAALGAFALGAIWPLVWLFEGLKAFLLPKKGAE